jgi:pimeloyl-ACP methyl ester carboxylesterase
LNERQVSLRTADGVKLHALLATVPNPIAVLILCHGLTTNCNEHGAFPALRDLALSAGMAVARFDFRGHGASGGTNENLTLAGERDDVDTVMAWVQAELGEQLPVISLGVSFGGAAAVHVVAGREAGAGVALWYAVVDYERNFGPASSAPMTQLMRASRGKGGPAWSGMPVVGTAYHLPTALLAEMAGDPTRDRLAALSVPVLGYYGSRDPFIDIAPIRELAASRRNIDLRIAYGAGHGFFTWRPWVLRRTVSWAAEVARRHE